MLPQPIGSEVKTRPLEAVHSIVPSIAPRSTEPERLHYQLLTVTPRLNMLSDDLPWPELGNVSRGATRGNQGQKGVLGTPDGEGRAILQLRVQPGVLAVRLNRQSTEWYRTLDSEVNNALKLTKTYWRKARRRQDYDARADQDHMELHEWLQQLKDKVMTHLELLMQKGEIQGPPYIMPDNIELSFLRKFMERHNSRIPHNPRLRAAYLAGHSPQILPHHDSIKSSEEGSTPASMGWDDQGTEIHYCIFNIVVRTLTPHQPQMKEAVVRASHPRQPLPTMSRNLQETSDHLVCLHSFVLTYLPT